MALANGVSVFDGTWADPEKVAVSQEDLFPNPPYTHDWQSRSFFFSGRLDDGTFLVINLFHWQLSSLHSWGLQVLVTDPSGRLFTHDGGLPPEETINQSDRFAYRFGEDVFMSSGNEQKVRIELPGFSCDLRIRDLLHAWEPGDGWVYLNAAHTAYVHYAVPCPLATVGGSILVFGNMRSVEGMCTWDSNLSVQPLQRPNSPVYSLRAFDASGAQPDSRLFIDMVESFTNAGYGKAAVPVLIVARGSTWLFATRDFTMAPADWTTVQNPPYPFPSSYRLSAAGRGWTLQGEFTSARMYSATDVFQKIPPIIRGFVSLFLKRPVLYRMVGDLQGTLQSPDGDEIPLSMPAHAEYVIVE